MKGKHTIVVQSDDVKFELTVQRNITILRGDSATGKSTIVDMIDRYNRLGKSSRVSIQCDKSCKVLGADDWNIRIGTIKDSIVFIDEENRKQHLISKYAYDICLYHHERYDGKGYPYKLKGDEIPIWAQIVGLVDVYDALLHEHVYRGAYDKKETLNMIINGKCGNFNPKLIDAFKNSSLTNI